MKPQLNLSMMQEETWQGFFDYLDSLWSDENLYGLHHMGAKGIYRVGCWDTPYVLEVTNLDSVDVPGVSRMTMVDFIRDDEVLGFKLKVGFLP